MQEDDTGDVVEFKKPRRRGNIRKRDDGDADGGDTGTEEGDSVVVSQPKRQKTSVTTASTKSSGPSKDDSTNFAFSSAGSQSLASQDNSIFGTLQTETERDRDAIAIAERNKKLQELSEDGKELYRGMGGYKQYVPTKTAGPLRTTTHVRMSVLFDYQPDICKDYKETGYCGYGDNCKFLHDRGDYKAGWQIDKEWNEQQKAMREGKSAGGDDYFIPEEEELPFACFICREPYKDPVVTKCGHYFCEDCALKHHEKDKRCFICKEPTLGIFNSATKILKRMEEAKKRKQQEEAEEAEKQAAQRALRPDGGPQDEHQKALLEESDEFKPTVV